MDSRPQEIYQIHNSKRFQTTSHPQHFISQQHCLMWYGMVHVIVLLLYKVLYLRNMVYAFYSNWFFSALVLKVFCKSISCKLRTTKRGLTSRVDWCFHLSYKPSPFFQVALINCSQFISSMPCHKRNSLYTHIFHRPYSSEFYIGRLTHTLGELLKGRGSSCFDMLLVQECTKVRRPCEIGPTRIAYVSCV